jgi:hypothetical protein
MSTFGTGTFGDGRFGDPSYEFVGGQYKRVAWKVRWDEGYEGKIGFAVPEVENMRYAAPQMEQGELPTAFALNPDDLLPGRVEGGGGLGHIAARTIIAEDIQANTITGNEIKAQSITATELDVGHLSAITADMGEITAGLITLDGGEAGLGGLIQSSLDDPKVTLDDRGLIKTSADASIALSIGPGESVKFGDPLINATTSTAVDSFTSGDTTLTGNTSSLGTSWAEVSPGISSLAVDTSGTGWAYHSTSINSHAANLLDLSPLDTSEGIVLHATMGAKSLLVGPGESVTFALYLWLEDNVGNFVVYHVTGVQTQTEASLINISSETMPIGSTFPNDLEMVAMVAANGVPKQTIDYGEGAISVAPSTSAAGKLDLSGPLTLLAQVIINPLTGGTQQSVGFDEIVAIEYDENLDRSIIWENSSTGEHTAGIIAQHTEDSTGMLPTATSLDLISYGPDATSPTSTLSLDVFSEDAAATVKVGEHSRLLLASDGSSEFQESIPLVHSFQLPSSPKHGQRCTLTFMDNLGELYAWDLVWNRYADELDGNGWVVIGATPMHHEVMVEQSTTSTSYTALTTAGPSITLPRAGVWFVEIEAAARSEGNARALMSYQVGATAASDDDAVTVGTVNAVHAVASVRSGRKKMLGAVTLSARYKSTSGGVTVHFSRRRMFARPVRLAS